MALRRHVVLNPIPPLGPAEKRAGLSGGSAAYQPHRPVERGGPGPWAASLRQRKRYAAARCWTAKCGTAPTRKGTPPVSPFNIRGHEMKPAINTQPRAQTSTAPGEIIVLPPLQVRKSYAVRRALAERRTAASTAAATGPGSAAARLAAGGDWRERLPDAAEHSGFGADAVFRPLLPRRTERYGHRLERAGFATAGRGGLLV